MLKALLNKGGAGKSISRSETANRLCDLLQQYNRLMFTYDAAINKTGDAELATRLDGINHGVRDDVAKWSELILSNGIAPPLGTDIETAEIEAEEEWSDVISVLVSREEAFSGSLKDEKRVNHGLRTVALLDNTSTNTKSRLSRLEELKN